jgi:hypothetical protein
MSILNQQARKDLNTRSGISDTVLKLIGRCGVDLLPYNEGLDMSIAHANSHDDSGRINELVAEGYEFAGFDLSNPNNPAIRMERLDGLWYPVPGIVYRHHA